MAVLVCSSKGRLHYSVSVVLPIGMPLYTPEISVLWGAS